MASRYLMQIVDRQTKEVVSFEPGKTVEVAFVEDCIKRVINQTNFSLTGSSQGFVESVVQAVLKRGVALKSATHVEQDLRDALHEVIVSGGFASEVQAVQEGLATRTKIAVEGAILELKKQVQPV